MEYRFQKFNFELIVAAADVHNRKSIAVMKRLGMFFDRRESIDGDDAVFYKIERSYLVKRKRHNQGIKKTWTALNARFMSRDTYIL